MYFLFLPLPTISFFNLRYTRHAIMKELKRKIDIYLSCKKIEKLKKKIK